MNKKYYDKFEYIIQNLENPQRILAEEFQQWIKEDENNKLFQNVMVHREAMISKNMDNQLDVDHEYRIFKSRYESNRSKKRIIRNVFRLGTVAAVIAFTIISYFTFYKATDKNELSNLNKIASGVQLILQDGKSIRADNEQLDLVMNNGVMIETVGKRELTYAITSNSNKSEELIYHTLRTPAGADYYVQLSDGSKVWLNCETTLRYPVSFASDKREVFLDGEAFFDVVGMTEKPFIVKSDLMTITVTGTRFNVMAYKTQEEVKTTLVEGKVKVNDQLLVPNMQYILNRETLKDEVREVDTDHFTGWINGMFVFKSQSLESVMNVLARWYQLKLFWQQDHIKEIKFSGNLPRYENIDVLLEMLQKIGKVEINRNDKTLIIQAK